MKQKHYVRTLAMCFNCATEDTTPTPAQIHAIRNSAVRASVKITGSTSDKINVFALQLLCVVVVWHGGYK